MKRFNFIIIFITILIFYPLFFTISAHAQPMDDGWNTHDNPQAPNLPEMSYVVRTDKSIYDSNEPVKITFKISNRGNCQAKINFSSKQQLDVIVKDGTGELWQLSSHLPYTHDPTTLILNPGETKTLNAQWDQKNDLGMTLPAGVYTIGAFLTSIEEHYSKIAATQIAIETLPRFSNCQELKAFLDLVKPTDSFDVGSTVPPGSVIVPWYGGLNILIPPVDDWEFTLEQVYVTDAGNTMIMIGNVPGRNSSSPWNIRSTYTRIYVYDISDSENPIVIRDLKFEASYCKGKKVNDTIYVIMNEVPPYELFSQILLDQHDLLPIHHDSSIHPEGIGDIICDCDQIAYFPGYIQFNYSIVVSISMDNPEEKISSEVIAVKTDYVYATGTNLYMISNNMGADTPSTFIYKFRFDDGSIKYMSNVKIPGIIEDRFSKYSMDENNDHFRIATTSESGINIYIFDSEMKRTGMLEGVAQGKRIKSIQFEDDRCSIIISGETDPSYIISLEDPANPKLVQP